MESRISQKELDFLRLLFRKCKPKILAKLKKEKVTSRANSFSVLSHEIFENCTTLNTKGKKAGCFRLFQSAPNDEFVECISGLCTKGHLHSLLRLCESKIATLPDPKTKPKKFVDNLFELLLLFSQISTGNLGLNPNTDKKCMQAAESMEKSASSSSVVSENYCADDTDETDKSADEGPPPLAKRRRSRRQPVVKMETITRKEVPVLPVEAKSDDRSYLADESSSSGTQKLDMEKWANTYDQKKELVPEGKPKALPRSILRHSLTPESSTHVLQIKSPPVLLRQIKTRLAPVKAVPLNLGPPKELMMQLRSGPNSKPASLKTEQIKLVLARRQQLDMDRTKTIQQNQRSKEQRMTNAKMSLQKEGQRKRVQGVLSRQERVEMARIRRKCMEEQRTKAYEMKGLVKSSY